MKKIIAVLLIIISSIFYFHRNNDKKIERERFIERCKELKEGMGINDVERIIDKNPDYIFDNKGFYENKLRLQIGYSEDYVSLEVYFNDSLKLDDISIVYD